MSNVINEAGDGVTLQAGEKHDPAIEGDESVAMAAGSLNLDQSRRKALKKFAAFSAPAMIALITANEAAAS